MVKKFSNQWEFYPTQMEGNPYSIRFDTAVTGLRQQDRARHPHTGVVAVLFEDAREDGFPTREEMGRLNAIEDAFQEAESLYLIGVLTGDGCCRFVFCYGGEPEAYGQAVKALLKKSFNVRYRQQLFENDNFGYFNKVLAPNRYEANQIFNYKVCYNLEQHGDNLKIPRPLDFYCYFSNEGDLDKAAAELAAKGFREEKRRQCEDGQWGLEFTLEQAPELSRMNAITAGIMELMDSFDGHFDGWGCNVVKSE